MKQPLLIFILLLIAVSTRAAAPTIPHRPATAAELAGQTDNRAYATAASLAGAGFITSNALTGELLIYTNFISGFVYTNSYGKAIKVSAPITTVSGSGAATMQLRVEGTLTNSISYPLGLGTFVDYLAIEVPTNALYAFSNFSAGTSTATPGYGQIVVPGSKAAPNLNAATLDGYDSTDFLLTNSAVFASQTSTGILLNLTSPLIIPTSLAVSGDARTNQLWVSATKGNDATALKGQPSLAWQTMWAAMTNTAPGDMLIVSPGSYNETIEVLSNRTVHLEKGALVGTLGTTNRTGDATNWVWMISGQGTITNLFCWSRNSLHAECWRVDGGLSFAYEGAHRVKVTDWCAPVTLGNIGTEPVGNYEVTANTGPASLANTLDFARLTIRTRLLTNGFSMNTTVAGKSTSTHLVSDYIAGSITAQSSTTQPCTNKLLISGPGRSLTWTNGQLLATTLNKAAMQIWVTVQNTDWMVIPGSNAVHTPTTGSGLLHLRLRNVYLDTPSVTNGGANYMITPNSLYYTNEPVSDWTR
jgi:hypothetical protein